MADPQLVWHRLHPVTPFVRGWGALVALLVFGSQEFYDVLWGMDVAANLGRMLAVLGTIALLVFGFAILAWRRLTYAVDANTVYKRQGVIFRRERQAPLDRLQAVDIRQPLLARAFGLAELQLEVAGGAGSGVNLGFLKLSEAQALRAELLARAAGLRVEQVVPDVGVEPGSHLVARTDAGRGLTVGDGPPVRLPSDRLATDAHRMGSVAPDEAPVEPLFDVSPGILIRSKLRSPSAIIGLILVLVPVLGMAGFAATGNLDIASVAWTVVLPIIPVIAMSGWQLFQSIATELNFDCGIAPDGIRISRGLFETRFQTIPPGRIAAVVLSQGPLWRKPNWWRVRVAVIGYQGNQQSEVQGTLLPVGTWEQALIALWLALPELGTDNDAGFLLTAATGCNPNLHNGDSFIAGHYDGNADAGSLPSNAIIWNPRRSRILDPFAWRRNGIAITPRALLIRSGRLVRTLTVVPHERTQSLQLTQGPIERRLGLAELYAQVPSLGFSAVNPVAHHLDGRVAASLLREQAVRARTARASDRSERWMVS